MLPIELFGTEKAVRAFSRRLARKLYRGSDPEAVWAGLDYISWDTHPTDIIIQQGSWAALVDRGVSFWRLCELGMAMQSQLPKLFDAQLDSDERLEWLDQVMLEGMKFTWFTMATLNLDWTDFWRSLWRSSEELQPVASSYLERYLRHVRTLQAFSLYFRTTGNTGMFGIEGEIMWTAHIAQIVHYATNRKVTLEVLAHGGDLCAALESAGFQVP